MRLLLPMQASENRFALEQATETDASRSLEQTEASARRVCVSVMTWCGAVEWQLGL